MATGANVKLLPKITLSVEDNTSVSVGADVGGYGIKGFTIGVWFVAVTPVSTGHRRQVTVV